MIPRALALPLMALLLALHFGVQAQAPVKTYRIGFLRAAAPPESYVASFRQGLAELGYVEGRNLALEYRWAGGRIDRLPELAAELVRLKADVIVIDGMPAVLAAKNATASIPIVMAGIGDPVATGVVANLTRPGGNITGMTIMAAELSGKRLAVLRELVPAISRFGVLTNPDNAAHVVLLRETLAAAQVMNVTLRVIPARSGAELDAAFTAMVGQGVGAFTVLPDQVLSSERARIIQLAARNKLPALYERKESVIEGGLVSYGVNYQAMYRRAAYYIDRVLKGGNPGDMSIEQPTSYELVVNKTAAAALGVTIPDSLLLRADQVVD